MAMPVVVYVLEIGELKYATFTKPFIESYCRRHGYPLIYATETQDASRHPAWNKLLVHRQLDADLVLLMDLDVCPVPHAPPIHEHLHPRFLSMFAELPVSHFTQRIAERSGVRPEWLCYNTGVLGVPRDAAPFLETVYLEADLSRQIYWEQGELCIQIAQHNVPVHELDQAWNTIPRRNFDPTRQDVFFWHFAGIESRRRRFAQQLWEYYQSAFTTAAVR